MDAFLKDVWMLARWWLLLFPFRLVEDRLHAWANSKIDQSQWFKAMMEWWGGLLDLGLGIAGLIFLFGIMLSFLIVAIKLKGNSQDPPTTQSVEQARDVQQVTIDGDNNAVLAGPREIHNVTSYGQADGVTAHTVNLAPGQRRMNQELATELLAQLPKDKDIDITAVSGDAEAFEFATEIKDFLLQKGFKINGVSVGIFVGAVVPLNFDQEKNQIVVGNNR